MTDLNSIEKPDVAVENSRGTVRPEISVVPTEPVLGDGLIETEPKTPIDNVIVAPKDETKPQTETPSTGYPVTMGDETPVTDQLSVVNQKMKNEPLPSDQA